MNNNNNEGDEQSTGGRPADTSNKNLHGGDLQDSEHDLERMQPEEVTLDLPDVKDIPGQEHIIPPNMGEFADTTISSDDEEGEGLFDDEEDEDEDADITMGTDTDVTAEEKTILQTTDEDMPDGDDALLRSAALDNTDNDGDLLNEEDDISGAGLDTSGVDGDDPMENIGEEDEENNSYSLGGDDKEEESENNNG